MTHLHTEVQALAVTAVLGLSNWVWGFMLILGLSGLLVLWLFSRRSPLKHGFRQALDDTGESFILLDRLGFLRYVSPRVARKLGSSRIALEGKCLWEVSPALVGTAFHTNYQKVLQEQVSVSFEAFLPSLNAWLELHAHPHVDGLIVHIRTITDRKQMEVDLALSEQRFRSLFDNHPDLIFALDMEGRFLSTNQAVDSVSGHTAQEVLGTSFIPYLVPESVPPAMDSFQRALAGEPQHYVIEILHKQGHRLHLQVTNVPMEVDGEVVGVYGIARNITDQFRTERALMDVVQGVSREIGQAFLTALVRRLAQTLGCAFALVGRLEQDGSGRIRAVAFCMDDQIQPAVVYAPEGTPCAEVMLHDLCCYPSNVTDHFPDDAWLAEMGIDGYIGMPLKDSSGKVIGVMAVMDRKPLTDPQLGTTLLQVYAVRAAAELERESMEAQLSYLAYHDPLTGLPNRKALLDRLEQALAHQEPGRRSALLFLDVDDFKEVNDSLGHLAGDRLLVAIVERLKGCLGAGQSLARLGGDELVILMPGVAGEQEPAALATRIGEAMSRPIPVEGHELFVTVSIGIALAGGTDRCPVSLLRQADLAVYEAKRLGKARFALFQPALDELAQNRLDLISDLRQALQRAEFVLHYQPIVSLRTAKPMGFEALIRWQHPRRGLVPPGEFIGLADEAGLMGEIGRWVLRTACLQAQAWNEAFGQDFFMNVNLSPRQFQLTDVPGEVAQVLRETGLPPACLQLEITEGAMMQGDEATLQTLQALRDLGVKLAVDDFGTGYSSLSYLKHLPVNTLKIDRSFIQALGDDPRDTAIVQAIIATARALQLMVTAEGIERPEQVALLAGLGCDRGQGFYFGRPLPPETLADWLSKRLQSVS